MIRKLILAVFLSYSISSAGQVWNCGLRIQNQILPFQLERQSTQEWILWNGSERIPLEAGLKEGDSLRLTILVFDAWIRIPAQPPAIFTGSFSKGDARIPGYQMSFTAKISKDRSPKKASVRKHYKEEERTIYFLGPDGLKADSGILRLTSFHQTDRVEATILTPTGDFRFLNGTLFGNDLRLSTFDGGHTYFFRLRKNRDSFSGRFYFSRSGSDSILVTSSGSRPLPSGFRQSSGRFTFQALDKTGQTHTEKDPELNGRPMVVQLMGTWCPNCMDESRFLTEMYPIINEKVAVVGLAFERKNQKEYGFERIEVVRRKLNLPYPVYLAGPASKDSASRLLPSIAPVEAFPTTVFVKADGSILKVHSGFTGPATGPDYQSWKREFLELVNMLSETQQKSPK